MAELQEVYRALKKADEAGNEEDARRLAAYARQLRQQQPSGEPTTIEQGAEAAGGLLSRAGQAVRSGAEYVADLYTGPEGLPDLPEFDPPRPVTLENLGQSGKTAAGLLASTTPEQERDIIAANYPGAEITPVQAQGDERTYYMVDYTDPDTGERTRGYVNAPGLSFRDVTRTLGQGAAYGLAAGRGGAGQGLARAFAGQGARAAGTSLALDAAAEQAGSEQGLSPTRAAVAGVTAGLFNSLAPRAARLWRQILGRTKYFNSRTGQLTAEGAEAARKAGLDPDEMAPALRQTFARYAEDAGDPEVAARLARTGEFGIRGTRGQITKDYRQLNLEERMARGLEGDATRNVMRDFRQGQTDDIARAAEGFQRQFGGGAPRGREAEAGRAIQEGLSRRAEGLMGQVDEAYEAVRAGGDAGVGARALDTLDDSLRSFQQVREVDPSLTPATTRALQRLSGLRDALDDGVLDYKKIETQRRVLNQLSGASANPTDRANVNALKATLDDWLDDSIDEGLMTGNPEVIQQLKQARGLRAQYGRLFEGRRGDKAGEIVQKITTKAETPEQAVNYLFGRGALGNKAEAAAAAKRIKEIAGPDSDEWGAMRELAWMRMTRDARGEIQSPKKIVNAFNESMTRNSSLMKELFSEPEISRMRQFTKALEDIQTDPTNPSGTAFALESALRYSLRRFGQRESFTKGNVGRGAILQALSRVPFSPAQTFGRERLAERAVSNIPLPRPSTTPAGRAIGGAVTSGVTQQ